MIYVGSLIIYISIAFIHKMQVELKSGGRKVSSCGAEPAHPGMFRLPPIPKKALPVPPKPSGVSASAPILAKALPPIPPGGKALPPVPSSSASSSSSSTPSSQSNSANPSPISSPSTSRPATPQRQAPPPPGVKPAPGVGIVKKGPRSANPSLFSSLELELQEMSNGDSTAENSSYSSYTPLSNGSGDSKPLLPSKLANCSLAKGGGGSRVPPPIPPKPSDGDKKSSNESVSPSTNPLASSSSSASSPSSSASSPSSSPSLSPTSSGDSVVGSALEAPKLRPLYHQPQTSAGKRLHHRSLSHLAAMHFEDSLSHSLMHHFPRVCIHSLCLYF